MQSIIEVKKINNDCIRYNFQINKNEFDVFVEKAFDKVKYKVEIKGFRKGCVTRTIFEKRFGSNSLYKDAFEILVQDKLNEISKNKDYDIVGAPKIVDFQFEDLINKKDFFHFGLEFFLKPDIKLCDYKKIIVNVPNNIEISKEEIQKKLNYLLKKHPILEDKKSDINSLELGDFAIFDFEGYLDGKLFEGGSATNCTLEIGSNNFIPDFEKGMIGMKVNEKRDISVIFPNDYLNKKFASKKVIFKIFLHKIKIKKDVIWNDELVQMLKFPGITNLTDFENQVKKELEIQKKYEKEKKQKKAIIDFLIQNSSLMISSFFIDEEINNLKRELEENLKSKNMILEQYLKENNLTNEKLEQNMKEKAFMNVKTNFLLDEIALIEKIKCSSEELELYFSQIQNELKIDIKKIKENSFFIENIKKDLMRQKVIEFLFKTNIIND